MKKNDSVISRKAVDRIIDKWLSYPDYEQKYAIFDMTRKIHKLPSVDTEPRWIPVIEKLPEEDGCYIVTMKIPFYENGAYGYITGAAYYISCVMNWYDANGEVIAWMPLPDPYTGVEDE